MGRMAQWVKHNALQTQGPEFRSSEPTGKRSTAKGVCSPSVGDKRIAGACWLASLARMGTFRLSEGLRKGRTLMLTSVLCTYKHRQTYHTHPQFVFFFFLREHPHNLGRDWGAITQY